MYIVYTHKHIHTLSSTVDIAVEQSSCMGAFNVHAATVFKNIQRFATVL